MWGGFRSPFSFRSFVFGHFVATGSEELVEAEILLADDKKATLKALQRQNRSGHVRTIM